VGYEMSRSGKHSNYANLCKRERKGDGNIGED
jgi:hypothetical protein